jgi:hypothetical protein
MRRLSQIELNPPFAFVGVCYLSAVGSQLNGGTVTLHWPYNVAWIVLTLGGAILLEAVNQFQEETP